MRMRFSAPVQTGPGAYPASCAMGTGSFPGVKSSRGVTLIPHPFPVPLVMKEWSYNSTPAMGRTAGMEPQCLYKGALYVYHLLAHDVSLSRNSFLWGKMGRCNSVGVVTTLQARRPRTWFRIPIETRGFFLCQSGTDCSAHPNPCGMSGLFPLLQSDRSVNLTTDLCLLLLLITSITENRRHI